jgi:hypothetical protein
VSAPGSINSAAPSATLVAMAQRARIRVCPSSPPANTTVAGPGQPRRRETRSVRPNSRPPMSPAFKMCGPARVTIRARPAAARRTAPCGIAPANALARNAVLPPSVVRSAVSPVRNAPNTAARTQPDRHVALLAARRSFPRVRHEQQCDLMLNCAAGCSLCQESSVRST